MHPNIRYGTDGNASLIEDVSCSIRSYLTLLQCNVYDTYSTECSNHNYLDLVINCCEYYVKVHVLIYHLATFKESGNYDCFVVIMYDCLLQLINLPVQLVVVNFNFPFPLPFELMFLYDALFPVAHAYNFVFLMHHTH